MREGTEGIGNVHRGEARARRARDDGAITWLERIFLAFVLFAQLYYSYRYPLRYNAESTSPTYRDTPAVWQAGKYVITLGLLGIAILFAALGRRRRTITPSAVIGWVLITCILVYNLGLSVAAATAGAGLAATGAAFRSFFYFPFVLLMPLFYRGRPTIELLLRQCAWMVGFHIVYSIIQIVAFLGWGRMPALAWAGALVRFGGAWDDPNGFGLFAAMALLFLLAFQRPGRGRGWRNAAIVAMGLLLLLTASISAVGAFVIALFAFSILARRPLIAIAEGIVGVVIGIWAMSSPFARFLWAMKSESVAGHLSSGSGVHGVLSIGDFVAQAGPFEWVFGYSSKPFFHESYYVDLLMNFGLVGLLLLLTFVGLTLIRGLALVARARARHDLFTERFAVGLTSALFAFAVGSFGIPYFSVFPVNVLFWIGAAILWLPMDPIRGSLAMARPVPVPAADALRTA